MLKCALQTPTTGQDASYKLNVVSEVRSGVYRVGRIIIVTLLWSEIMGGYSTPDTMVEIKGKGKGFPYSIPSVWARS